MSESTIIGGLRPRLRRLSFSEWGAMELISDATMQDNSRRRDATTGILYEWVSGSARWVFVREIRLGR